MANTLRSVYKLVWHHPGLDKRQLVRLLREQGYPDATTSELNRVLYGYPHHFEARPGGGQLRIWFARGPAPAELAAVGTLLGLYPWQRRALQAWSQYGSRGVIEAVTGAGKTRVALAAAYLRLATGGRVAAIVPTLALVDQWIEQFDRHLRRYLPSIRIGRLGGGSAVSLSACQIVVATVHSASSSLWLPDRTSGLLIADECHHYGAPEWSWALDGQFDWRLGLTATYERDDTGVDDHVNPYFDGVCYSADYREALADGVIARFKIAFVGAPSPLRNGARTTRALKG
jgi:RNA polymerase primary sigma factor